MGKMVTSADLGRQVTEKVLFIWSPASSAEGCRTESVACVEAGSSKSVLDVQEPKTNSNPTYESWVFLTALARAAFLSNCTAALVLNTYHPQLLCMPSYHTTNTRRGNMDGQRTAPKAALTHAVVCFSSRKLFMPLSPVGELILRYSVSDRFMLKQKGGIQ